MLNPVTLHTSDGRINNAWKGLVRRMQTIVEATRLTNGNVAAAVRGTIVHVSNAAPRTFDFASDADGATAKCIGVATHAIAPGASGIIRTDNVAYVRFIDGIVGLAAGDAVYSSATAGRATNAWAGLTAIYRFGIVFDSSTYVSVTNPFAWVLLDRCCEPQQIIL